MFGSDAVMIVSMAAVMPAAALVVVVCMGAACPMPPQMDVRPPGVVGGVGGDSMCVRQRDSAEEQVGDHKDG